jgi:hypothetical protein
MEKTTLLLFVLPVLVLLCLAPLSSGISSPNINFYPTTITKDSAFVAIAEPNPGFGEVVRVEWQTTDGVDTRSGLFPFEDGMWMCFFSNTETSSTCGPSPFTQTGVELGATWEIDLTAINQNGETTTETHEIDVGSINLVPSYLTLYPSDEIVYVAVYPKYIDSGVGISVINVDYSIYNTDMTVVKTGQLDWVLEMGAYRKNITLAPGDYFMSFKATQNGGTDFGGVIINLTMPGGEGGGEPGTTDGYVVSAQNVTGKTIEFYTTGQTFNGYANGFTLTNVGSSDLENLTADVPDSLSDYLDVRVYESEFLGSGDSTKFNFTIGDIPAGESLHVDTFVDIVANVSEGGVVTEEDAVVGQIYLQIAVSVIGGASGECTGKQDSTSCASNTGLCVLETCVIGAECVESDDCSGSQVCQGLSCVSAGGCPTGQCYFETCPSTAPELTIFTGYTCDFSGSGAGDGSCCNPVECVDSNDCAGSLEPYCYSNTNTCVECLSDSDCGSGYECSGGKQCVVSAVSCFTGFCYDIEDGCPTGSTNTGTSCTSPNSGITSGVCCELSGGNGGTGEGMDIIQILFIVIIVFIVGVGVWYYFKKVRGKGRGRGRRGRSKEEEDLEKELGEEF